MMMKLSMFTFAAVLTAHADAFGGMVLCPEPTTDEGKERKQRCLDEGPCCDLRCIKIPNEKGVIDGTNWMYVELFHEGCEAVPATGTGDNCGHSQEMEKACDADICCQLYCKEGDTTTDPWWSVAQVDPCCKRLTDLVPDGQDASTTTFDVTFPPEPYLAPWLKEFFDQIGLSDLELRLRYVAGILRSFWANYDDDKAERKVCRLLPNALKKWLPSFGFDECPEHNHDNHHHHGHHHSDDSNHDDESHNESRDDNDSHHDDDSHHSSDGGVVTTHTRVGRDSSDDDSHNSGDNDSLHESGDDNSLRDSPDDDHSRDSRDDSLHDDDSNESEDVIITTHRVGHHHPTVDCSRATTKKFTGTPTDVCADIDAFFQMEAPGNNHRCYIRDAFETAISS